MKTIFETNQLALQFTKAHVKEMQDFARMLSGFGIQHFHYTRIYDDGRYIHLVDSEDYAEFYKNEVDNVPSVFENVYRQGFREFIWPQKNLEGFLLKARNYGVCNGFNIARFYEHYYEGWSFSTAPEHTSITNTYLCKGNDLKCFGIFFNNMAASLIKEAEKTPGRFKNYNFAHHRYWKETNSFSLNLPFVVNEQAVYLSSRELECLRMLSEGLMVKEIAKKLNLSSRTVEFYINNVKQKLNVTTTSHAIAIHHSQKRPPW